MLYATDKTAPVLTLNNFISLFSLRASELNLERYGKLLHLLVITPACQLNSCFYECKLYATKVSSQFVCSGNFTCKDPVISPFTPIVFICAVGSL